MAVATTTSQTSVHHRRRIKASDLLWAFTFLGWLCSALAIANIGQRAFEVGLAPVLDAILGTYRSMIHPISDALLWWLVKFVGPLPELLKDLCALSYLGAFAAARWELLRPEEDFSEPYVIEIFEKPDGAARGSAWHAVSVYSQAVLGGTLFVGLLTWGAAIAALPMLPLGLFLLLTGQWSAEDFLDQVRPEFVLTIYTAPAMAFAFFALNTQM